MALCYWREGALDEARVLLTDALAKLHGHDGDLKAVAMLRSAIVEWSAKRFHDAIELAHRTRKLGHRSATPIVVLSATPVGAAAFKAAADEFLQKPQAVGALVATITRLLRKYGNEG